MAAKRRKPVHLEKMKAEFGIQRDPIASHEDFCHSDVRFHRIIVEATGNAHLRLIIDPVFDALQPIFNMAIYRYRERDTIVSQHKQIHTASENHDADKAVKVMKEHLDDLHEQMHKAHQWRKNRDKNLFNK